MRRSLLVTLCLLPVAILIGVGFAWMRYLDAPPQYIVPASVLPPHNAFDDFLHASSQAKHDTNDLRLFREGLTQPLTSRSSVPNPIHPPSDVLRQNAAALQVIRLVSITLLWSR